MKHIKKKLLQEPISLPDDTYNYVINTPPDSTGEAERRMRDEFENHLTIIITEDKKVVQGFNYENKQKGIKLIVPEPHPVVLYFSQAQQFYRHLTINQEKLFEEAKKSLDPHESLEVFHAYFMHSSGFILNLFIAIEAFSNHLIPEEYKYVKPTRTCTEMYNKEEILRNISFDEKIKKVIPEIKNQSFHEKHGHLFDHLLKLKEFRDEIMHTKPSNGKSFKYQGLFVRALDFNYHSTIYAARDFINFYEPNLIEECGCGQDF